MKTLLERKREPILVIDIGGTYFRYALYSPENNSLSSVQRELIPNFTNTPYVKIEELQKKLITKIVQLVVQTKKNIPTLSRVGISFPSAITPKGVTYLVPTLWGREGGNFPILQILSHEIPEISWLVENDITAATERYVAHYAKKNIDYLGVFTISSGVGNKIYDMRRKILLLNNMGFGGEIGHATLDFSDTAPLCDCGAKGHLGALASGRAIERTIREYSLKHPQEYEMSGLSKLSVQAQNITSTHIVQAINQGDSYCLHLLDNATRYLAVVFSIFYHGIGVDKFVIIGGFANACGLMFQKSIVKNMQKIGYMAKHNDEIESMVDIGINDGNDCLHGVGILVSRRWNNEVN